jgi:diguanylate cyclase (GGDEF)-like protein
MMFDIDHFKDVNDTYGHQAGDEVIRQTSRTLQRTIRKTDVAGRYGGEEFAVLLVNTEKDNAHILAERLRKRIEALTIQYDGMEIKFKISLGLAELDENLNDHTEWLEQADQALYYSKENGRNQTTIYSKDKIDKLKNVG